MADQELAKDFPDISSKLAAPKKISAYEKERQEAAAKRQRDEEETAAALKDFEKEFGVSEEDAADSPPAVPGLRGVPSGSGTHGMSSLPPRTGPGSLGPLPGVSSSQKRKRDLGTMQDASLLEDDEDDEHDLATFHRAGGAQSNRRQEEASKPTVQLSSLPHATTEKAIKDLLADQLPVHSVRLMRHESGISAQRSLSAIATLDAGTTNAQIDNAVSKLNNKYMGLGHFLSISRHLSSTALHPSVSEVAITSGEPFGAERPQQRAALRNPSSRRDHRGYAPPDNYQAVSEPEYGLQVTVRAPAGIETVRAVHLLADRLLSEHSTQHAMQLEALLMSMPSVQHDPRFAFLFNARTPVGVYYRYLLWSDDDPNEAVQAKLRQPQSVQRIFDDPRCDWVLPNGAVTFPDLIDLGDVVGDIDYVSSDEETDDEDTGIQFKGGRNVVESSGMDREYMTPLQRARLVHLLSRLPTSHTMLRKGDVARITNFAISHAGTAAEEIVGVLLLNITRPFSYTLAAKYEDSDEEQDQQDDYEPSDGLPTVEQNLSEPPKGDKREDDPSSAKLVALYVISDILFASSSANVKNAWKYRSLFETGIGLLKIFEYLGKLDKELGWGRIKVEQWKRRVGQVFELWESWSPTFTTEALAQWKQGFFEPPLSALERADEERRKADEEKKMKQTEVKEKLQAMKDKVKATKRLSGGFELGKTYSDENDADVPMVDICEAPAPSSTAMEQGLDKERAMTPSSTDHEGVGPLPQKKRMRAEDMFAESDEE
nr:u2 snrnp-associated surp motif-containing protein [Quercus suber]